MYSPPPNDKIFFFNSRNRSPSHQIPKFTAGRAPFVNRLPFASNMPSSPMVFRVQNSAPGVRGSNNGSKGNAVLQVDLFGDWREEVMWRTADNQQLRIYSTPIPTEHKLFTLMHDPIYRLGIAWQNVGYNQPPHTSFYLGTGMNPALRMPEIELVKFRGTKSS